MNINIINGNGEYVKSAIDKTVDAAISYYGDKYRDIIINTIKETKFYEWEDNQTESDVMFDLHDGEIDFYEDNNCELGAFYYLKIDNKKMYDKIVVFRNKYLKNNYHYLVHELFGHGVFGYIKPVLMDEDGYIWQRNGIAFIDYENSNIYNLGLNEGFVEDATVNIMNTAGLHPRWFDHYYESKKAASVIRNQLGHEVLYDSLILFDGDIALMYDKGTKKDEFYQLSKLIDNYSYCKVSPKQNGLLNDNIRRFIKRRKKLV